MNIIVCQGKTGNHVTDGEQSIGDTAIVLVSASGMTAGDYAFIDDTVGGGGELEALGKIDSIDGNTINTEHGLVEAKASGAAVWVADDIVDFGMGSSVYLRTENFGIAAERTAGGVFITNKISDETTEFRITIPYPTFTTNTAWNAFVNTTLSGYEDFTFVDTERNIFSVRVIARTNATAKATAANWRSLSFFLGVVEAGAYT